MTYNVLHPEYANTYLQKNPEFHVNTWKNRQQKIVSNISQLYPEIAVIQEISEDRLQNLVTLLNTQPAKGTVYKYEFAQHRDPWGNDKKDGVAILYATNRFERTAIRTIYAVDAAQQQKAKGRAALVLTLADANDNNTTYQVCGVHLEGGGGKGRKEGDQHLQKVVDRVTQRQLGGCATIIAGDMNQDETPTNTDPPYYSRLDILSKAGYKEDGSRTSSEWMKRRKIDWIFVHKNPLQPLALRQINISLTVPEVQAASDHAPVCTWIVPSNQPHQDVRDYQPRPAVPHNHQPRNPVQPKSHQRKMFKIVAAIGVAVLTLAVSQRIRNK